MAKMVKMESEKRKTCPTIIPMEMLESKRRKTCPSITPMEMVSQIEDLILEIFYRLPVKSLFRFKCVSKHWFSLISHPSFRRKHSSHQPPPDSSISAIFFGNPSSWHYYPPEFAPIDKPNSGVPDPSLSFLGRDFSVSHSCNGLLLCEHRPDGSRHERDITYCVCNPTTMEYVLLPQPPDVVKDSISIAFDPSKSAHYKIVSISGAGSANCHVNIYSSETGLWRLSELSPRIFTMYGNGVFWNGALHWTALSSYDQSTLSFHVEKESFQTTKLPPPKPTPNEIHRICKYFGESNGHLYLIETYNEKETEFHILEMEPDYSQWSIRHRVNFDSLLKAYPEMLRPDGVLYSKEALKGPCEIISFTALRFLVRERGELVLWMCIPGKIIWYRITDGSFGKYCDLATRIYGGLHFAGYSWYDVHPYSNTFSSVQPSSS